MIIAGLIAIGIGGIIKIAGAIIETIGAVHELEALEEQRRLEAENLEELSEEGGYYDQVLEALQVELDDIEADRMAATQNLIMTTQELTASIGVSKLQEAAAIVGQEAQKAGQVVQGLGAARQGSEIGGALSARAGAGGVSVGSGSVLRTAAALNRAVSRQVAMANINIGATNQEMAATRAAGAYQREVLQNNITRERLNFQNTQRGLDTREAQLTAQETLTEYNQETGQERADLLQTEADWIQESGIPLTVLGGALNVAGAAIDTITRLSGVANAPASPTMPWPGVGDELALTPGTY